MTSLTRHSGRAMLRLGLLALLALTMLGLAPATTYAVPKGRDIYVDPVEGSDANTGELTQPFRTLFKALTSAQPGDIVRLAKGVYSQATNGEQFGSNTAPIPAVSVVAIVGAVENGLPASTLQGTGSEVGLRLQSNTTVSNLNLSGFDMAVLAVAGKNTLSNLSITQNAVGVWAGNASQTTLTGSRIDLNDNTTGVLVAGQAQFIMDGGKINGGLITDCATGATGLFLFQSGQATLKNGVTLEGIAGTALAMQETSKATLDNTTINRSLDKDDCTPKPSVRVSGSASLTLRSSLVRSLQGVNAAGIEMQDGAQITLDNSTVTKHTGTGIRVLGTGKLLVNGGSLTRNQIGIDASGAPQASITITGATVRLNIKVAIIAPTLKLRNSNVSDNDFVGIKITGPAVDLGTLSDPGNNTIQNNQTGVTFASSISSGSVQAVDNTWNPNTQDSDASGHYTLHIKVIGIGPFAHGQNFDLPNGNFSIQL